MRILIVGAADATDLHDHEAIVISGLGTVSNTVGSDAGMPDPGVRERTSPSGGSDRGSETTTGNARNGDWTRDRNRGLERDRDERRAQPFRLAVMGIAF